MPFRPLLLCLALSPVAALAQAQTAAPAGVPVSQSILDGYAGDYRTTAGIRLHIWRDGNGLQLQAEGQAAWALVAESENIFVVPAQQARITFAYDAGGRPGYLVLEQGGASVHAVRE